MSRPPGTPRPPRHNGGPTLDPALGDPANGEKVPRCKRCGMPDRPGVKLIPGMWGYIRFLMPFTLCEKCVLELAPHDPQMGDPLTLEDVA